MNTQLYSAAANSYFDDLHELRLARARRAGLDVSNIPPITAGGDHILAELMAAAGLPETHGEKEYALLSAGTENSRASAICPN